MEQSTVNYCFRRLSVIGLDQITPGMECPEMIWQEPMYRIFVLHIVMRQWSRKCLTSFVALAIVRVMEEAETVEMPECWLCTLIIIKTLIHDCYSICTYQMIMFQKAVWRITKCWLCHIFDVKEILSLAKFYFSSIL